MDFSGVSIGGGFHSRNADSGWYPPKAGRPKKWRGPESLQLVSVVQTISRERRRGIPDAIRMAKKRFPNLWKEYDEATLKTRYYESLRRPDVNLEDVLALLQK